MPSPDGSLSAKRLRNSNGRRGGTRLAEEKWEPLVVMRSLYVARSPVRLLSLGVCLGLFVSLGPMLLCRVASIHCPPSSPSWWTTPHVDYRFWGSVDCKLLLTICYATGGGALVRWRRWVAIHTYSIWLYPRGLRSMNFEMMNAIFGMERLV